MFDNKCKIQDILEKQIPLVKFSSAQVGPLVSQLAVWGAWTGSCVLPHASEDVSSNLAMSSSVCWIRFTGSPQKRILYRVIALGWRPLMGLDSAAYLHVICCRPTTFSAACCRSLRFPAGRPCSPSHLPAQRTWQNRAFSVVRPPEMNSMLRYAIPQGPL